MVSANIMRCKSSNFPIVRTNSLTVVRKFLDKSNCKSIDKIRCCQEKVEKSEVIDKKV